MRAVVGAQRSGPPGQLRYQAELWMEFAFGPLTSTGSAGMTRLITSSKQEKQAAIIPIVGFGVRRPRDQGTVISSPRLKTTSIMLAKTTVAVHLLSYRRDILWGAKTGLLES